MAQNNKTFSWNGKYDFRICGTDLHEDTLRIKCNYRKQEGMLKLVLPTLCITYADLKFQDSIGGVQKNYPASQAYGSAYFDPPVVISGGQDIEKFTYIRGANKVVIGSKETTIEFPSRSDLVIPRLRIDREKFANFNLHVPKTNIQVDVPLNITALQYADGRHIGGVKLEKRHPDWKPEEGKKEYDLWVKVIDGRTLKPIPEAMVEILKWDPKLQTPYGTGGLKVDKRIYTSGDGIVQAQSRPSNNLEALVIRHRGFRAVARCFKPLAGQNVRVHMRAWPLQDDTINYKWKIGDDVSEIAELTGHTVSELLRINNLKDPSVLKPGMQILLPCYTAMYNMEQWDNLDWLGKAFGYKDAKGLAEVNGFKDMKQLSRAPALMLPGWKFFFAREKDTLEKIDSMFDLKKGSSITVGRVFHPDSRIPYPGETIAVPIDKSTRKLRRKK
jgi:hypothetical protein